MNGVEGVPDFPSERGNVPRTKGLSFRFLRGRGSEANIEIFYYFIPDPSEVIDGRSQLLPEPAAGPKRP